MKLTGLRPMIRTNNFEESIEFYTSILGFSIGARNDEWGWASLFKDHVAIMLAKPHSQNQFEEAKFTGSFYFNTDHVDELWLQVKDKVKVCYEIEDFEWEMREFAIYDNNGYLLQFGQDLS